HHKHLYFLLALELVLKFHVVTLTKLDVSVDADPAVSFYDLQRPEYFQIAPLPAQFANAGVLQHLHERLRRTVKNRHFDGVYVDVNVVDATGIDGGKHVLGGGKQNALLHEAGGIADASDVMALRFDMKIVQVNAAKHDACFRRRGYQMDVAVHSRVEAHTLGEGFSCDSSLEHFPHEYCSMLFT